MKLDLQIMDYFVWGGRVREQHEVLNQKCKGVNRDTIVKISAIKEKASIKHWNSRKGASEARTHL